MPDERAVTIMLNYLLSRVSECSCGSVRVSFSQGRANHRYSGWGCSLIGCLSKIKKIKKQTHLRDFNALKNKEMSLMMHLGSSTIASGGACGNCRSISVLYEKLKLSDSPNSGIVEYTEYSVLVYRICGILLLWSMKY